MSSQTIRPTELDKRDHHPMLPLPHRLHTFFFTSTMHCFKDVVNWVEVSLFNREDKVVKRLGR